MKKVSIFAAAITALLFTTNLIAAELETSKDVEKKEMKKGDKKHKKGHKKHKMMKGDK